MQAKCDSAYSVTEYFDSNSKENVYQVQDLEDAKVNQMIYTVGY